mmetsp:Transcript_26086/g.58800  ORF Transcript_26086/g.58800 Transcript_26086/m.58800 type:complete len:98 (-) Transcript_26086:2-295(-)
MLCRFERYPPAEKVNKLAEEKPNVLLRSPDAESPGLRDWKLEATTQIDLAVMQSSRISWPSLTMITSQVVRSTSGPFSLRKLTKSGLEKMKIWTKLA